MHLDFFYHERNLNGKIEKNYKGKADYFKQLKLGSYDKYKQKQLSTNGINKKSISHKTKLLFNYYKSIDLFLAKYNWITVQSKLRSTILEEFCGFLFKDLPMIKKLDLGFYNKNIFAGIAIDNFGNVKPKTKNVDFCIGKEIIASFGDQNYKIIVPVIAIECKTWLDKTMFNEAQFTAQKLKQGTPNVKVYILSGYSGIKKTEIPNKGQTPIDQIFLIGDTRRRIANDAVWQFFKEVSNDLKQITEIITIKDIGKILPE